MKASTVLSKARKLIAEKGHCKGELARNKYRHRIDPTNKNATSFCAFGAIQNVLGIPDKYNPNTDSTREVQFISEYLAQAIPTSSALDRRWWSVDDYNDRNGITLADVDRWFSRAIKLAKKAGN